MNFITYYLYKSIRSNILRNSTKFIETDKVFKKLILLLFIKIFKI